MEMVYEYENGIFESIKKFQFSLKILDHYIIYLSILFILILSYLFVVPFIKWLITLQSVRLLSYLLSSLFVLLVVFSGSLLEDQGESFMLVVYRVTFHCLSIFGLGLLSLSVIKKIFKH